MNQSPLHRTARIAGTIFLLAGVGLATAGADDRPSDLVERGGKRSEQPTPTVKRHSPKKTRNSGPPEVSLDLKWNEQQRTFFVTVPNPSPAPVKILGVQSTGDLYVTTVPDAIPANGEIDLKLLLFARRDGASADADVLRVLTEAGERVIRINYNRDKVVEYSATSLTWKQGEAPTPKTVTLTVVPNRIVPMAARALGEGNQVTLAAKDKRSYTVTVTPGSTATPSQFPVIITFDENAPGVPTVIGCAIVPNSN